MIADLLTILKAVFFILLWSFAIILPKQVKSQEVDVNHFTGSPVLEIPVYTVTIGEITVPVKLVYQSSGVKVKDSEGTAGIGWNVYAGGSIVRELRDLPDEINSGTGATSRKGWLYSGKHAKINSFFIQNDNAEATQADEAADIAYINTHLNDLTDLEPDIFHVNAPGLSCRLVFNQAGQLVPIEAIDIKVTHTLGTNDFGAITITNDRGIRYEFSLTLVKSKSTQSNSPASISFRKREYDLYKNTVYFQDDWHLISIKSGSNVIQFSYSESENITSVSPVEFYVGESTTKTHQYKITESFRRRLLKSIDFYRGSENIAMESINFNYRFNQSTKAHFVTEIFWKLPLPGYSGNIIDSRTFEYTVAANNSGDGKYKRYFLTGLYSLGERAEDDYKFSYVGLAADPTHGHKVQLPDSASTQLDLWGYYNGQGSFLVPAYSINPNNSTYDRLRTTVPSSLAAHYPYTTNGSPRNVNPSTVASGMLSKVQHPHGGATLITYEPNQYFDPHANVSMTGGGVRVKKITDQDLAGGAGDRVRNFTYTDPGTGKSTGSPISLPVLAFLRPYSGTGTTEARWKNSLARSDESLSKESDRIVYSQVSVMEPGRGSKRYTFSVPATYFAPDTLSDWSPSFTSVARPTVYNIGFLSGSARTYPFNPPTDYSFGQGLLLKMETLSESGYKVQEKVYEYISPSQNPQITALGLEFMGTTVVYSKYHINQGRSFLPSKETIINYDQTSGAKTKNFTKYQYGTNHYHPIRIETQRSDGAILKSHNKFIKDYSYTGSLDAQASAMKVLLDKNKNSSIETYQTIERNGSTRTISANLVKYAPFTLSGLTDYHPSEIFAFENASGVTGFQISNISAGQFSKDTRYWGMINYSDYDTWGNAISKNDGKGNVQTNLYSHYQQFAEIHGATPGQVSVNTFEDFSADHYYGLRSSVQQQIQYTEGKTGARALALPKNTLWMRTVQKNTDSEKDVFSIWIKATTAGTLTVVLTGTGGQVVSKSIPYSASDKWELKQAEFSVSTMTSSFGLTITSNQDISVDDVLLLPEGASAKIATLDGKTRLVTSLSDMNGSAKHFNYDRSGRLTQVVNADRDIIENLTYVNFGDTVKSSNINISGQTINQPVKLEAKIGGVEEGGMQYTWKFGDGSPQVTTHSPKVFHTYTAKGSYTVEVSVVSPFLDSQLELSDVIQIKGADVSIEMFGTITSATFIQGSSQQIRNKGTNVPIEEGIYTVKVRATGAYHPSQNPNGFKSITYRAYNSSNVLLNQGCVMAATIGLDVNLHVILTGADKVVFTTEFDECFLTLE